MFMLLNIGYFSKFNTWIYNIENVKIDNKKEIIMKTD